MKRVQLITFISLVLASAPAFAATLNGAEILKKVDSLRNPLASFQIDVDLVSYRNQESEAWKMRVFGQGPRGGSTYGPPLHRLHAGRTGRPNRV